MQGDLNSPRAPTQSNPHTQSLMHAYTQAFAHTLYMQEKNILTFALQNSTRASV